MTKRDRQNLEYVKEHLDDPSLNIIQNEALAIKIVSRLLKDNFPSDIVIEMEDQKITIKELVETFESILSKY